MHVRMHTHTQCKMFCVVKAIPNIGIFQEGKFSRDKFKLVKEEGTNSDEGANSDVAELIQQNVFP